MYVIQQLHLNWCIARPMRQVKTYKISSKVFLLTVPRRCFFCWSFMLFLSCFHYAFMHVCLLMPCGHPLGKDWPLGSRLWCQIVKLSLSHWYPGSAVVIDCIDCWSLPFFLLSTAWISQISVWFSRCSGKTETILGKIDLFLFTGTHSNITRACFIVCTVLSYKNTVASYWHSCGDVKHW